MTSTNIDYINNYFQYPELTPIHGEPTYEALQIIKDQLKSNSSSVAARLGGGSNGHLGLMLTAEEYARVSAGTPYVFPNPPPLLNIEAGTTAHETSRRNKEHTEALRTAREATDVKKALIKQIVKAIEPTYLRTLRNTETNSITRAIPEILAYLFQRYGKVTPDALNTKEMEVRSFVYNLQEPLVTLFDQVEDLQKLGDAALMPYTTRQIVNFGMLLIRNTHDFQDGLKTWFDKPEREKTWTNFKMHFETEHDRLKLVRGTTMQHAGFHHANFIASQVMKEVQGVQANVLELLQCHEVDKENATPPEAPEEHKANAATVTIDPNITMQMEMLKLMKSLQQDVNGMKSRNNNNNYHDNYNNRRQPFRNQQNFRNQERPFRPRRNKDNYCWSHGGCAHKGKDCKYKKQGHQDNATFENKMGGSTYYCDN